ncbi:MAG: bifunctional riboflavin kinase/FAD synthetase, partial [Capnocytophaga sp.]|nr:bifunctional riboflavin kinase/FAD synthetase [Capnocytophaga sp.]
MEKITDISSFSAQKPSVVTIGTFDGVHIGHQKIIRKLVDSGKKEELIPTVFTFFPHPRMVVQHDNGLKLIHTFDEKIQMMQHYGVQQLVIQPFDEAFSRLTAEEFVKNMLVDKLDARKVIIGYDHRFGRNRTADISDMRNFGKKYGFEVEEISVHEIDEVSVSSTKIRNALAEGDVKTAAKYLGHPYCLSGTVIHGMKIGRTLGYPTANIKVNETYKLIPKDGIYLVYSTINKKRIYGMLSIGNNPTIESKGKSIEVYYFDFNEDLYDKNLKINFLQKLREEQKFDSLEALKAQLQEDERTSREIMAD